MNCLLIDDDIPTLEALQHVINWDELGIFNINKATNIYEAKHIIESQQIDLMICDIEMPRGTGLELLRWIYESNHKGRFIFLTCHDSFEFASEAIQYNVDAYLLKPLDPLKIKTALMKSISHLQRSKESSENEQLSQRWINNVKLVENGFWRDVIMGTIYPDEKLILREANKRSIPYSDDMYSINLLCIDTSHLNVNWNEGLFLAALRNIAEEILESQTSLVQIFTYEQDDICYVCYVIPKTKEQIMNNYQLGKLLIDACRTYLKTEATVYISDEVKINSLFHRRLGLEQQHKNNKSSFGDVHVYIKDNLPQSHTLSEKGHYNFNNAYYLMLFQVKDKVKIINGIKDELDLLLAQNKVNIDVLMSFREDFQQVCYSYLTLHEIKARQLFADQSSLTLYSRAERSIYDFMKWAFFVSDKSIELVKQSKKFTGILDTALDYIHRNYKESLSREEIAATVYLNPDYFAKLFKQKIGKSLTEYINEYRIKIAKHLLIETDLSISQIAFESGFENISYFSTIFKKLTGQTPIHYRASIK